MGCTCRGVGHFRSDWSRGVSVADRDETIRSHCDRGCVVLVIGPTEDGESSCEMLVHQCSGGEKPSSPVGTKAALAMFLRYNQGKLWRGQLERWFGRTARRSG
jgi:hypothetical protein